MASKSGPLTPSSSSTSEGADPRLSAKTNNHKGSLSTLGFGKEKGSGGAFSCNRLRTSSCSQFASNVAETIFELSNEFEMDALVHTLTLSYDGQALPVVTMMQAPYANYVVQKMLDRCNPTAARRGCDAG